MPGFEVIGDEERKEVNEVLDTGILMRYGFDGTGKKTGYQLRLYPFLPNHIGP